MSQNVVAADVSSQPLAVGDVVQSIMDPSIGTWRERGLGVVTELDPTSTRHVWVSNRVWWDRHGTPDFLAVTPIRVDASLLFRIAGADADVMELIAEGHPDGPDADRVAELAVHDRSAAAMWSARPRP